MKKHRHILIFTVLFIFFIVSMTSSGTTVGAQGENIYFFPLFSHELDPYYYYGLDGGTVEGIVIDPTNSDIIYANSWGAGVYKSVDGGVTWVNKSVGLDSAYVYELAIDPSNPNHLLASDYEHGVKQSIDGGENWTEVVGLPPWCVIYSIDFNPVDPSIVYVALREPTQGNIYPGGVFKSINGGSNWQRSSSGLPDDYVYDLAIDPNNPSIIYTAQHRTGVYKTTNGGGSWINKSSNLIDGDVRSVQVTPDSSRVNIGFWDGYGFSYSTSGGDSWVSVNWTNSVDLYVYEVQVDPLHPTNVYLTTSTGIYLCQNPSQYSMCSVRAHPARFAFDLTLDVNNPANINGYTEVMYTGLQNFAIFKSATHGGEFKPMYQGIRANIINSVLVDPVDPAIQYVSASGRGLFKTTDHGVSGVALHYALPAEYINDLAFRPLDSSVIYAGTTSDGIQISYDDGYSWISGNSGLSRGEDTTVVAEVEDPITEDTLRELYGWMDEPDLNDMLAAQVSPVGIRATSYQDVTAIDFDLDPAQWENMLIGTNGSGVRLSIDGGQTWFASDNLTSGKVTDLLVNPTAANNNYLASLDGNYVWASTNMRYWYLWSNGLPPNVYTLEVIPGTMTYFAGTNVGIYRASGVGSVWTLTGLGGISVTDIQVDPANPTQLWATTPVGLYHSIDSGVNWAQYDAPGLYNQDLLTIVTIPDGGGGYDFLIGTNGGDYYTFSP